MKKCFWLTFIYCFIMGYAPAQNAVGDWQTHFSGRNAKAIDRAGEFFYTASEQMLIISKEGKIQSAKTKIDGLSDSDLKLVKYLPEKQEIFIVYENSNIDIISGNQLQNFPALKNKQISGDKSIYDLKIKDKTIWMATGFGIVLFDLQKKEFSDTYYIGSEGNFVNVWQILFFDSYIYAATSEGLKRASLDNDNLYNFQNWENIMLPQYAAVKSLVAGTRTIYALAELNDENTIIYRQISGGQWEEFEDYTQIQKIFKSENFLIFSEKNKLYIHDKAGNFLREKKQYSDAAHAKTINVQDIAEDQDGLLYFADEKYGTVKEIKPDKHSYIVPEGPYTNSVMQLKFINNKLTGTAGGFKVNLNPSKREASLFKYSLSNKKYEHIVFSGHKDFYAAASRNNDDNHLFVGTWNRGLYEIIDGKPGEFYNETNSSLQSILPNYRSVRIGAVLADEEQNLWMTNVNVAEPVSIFKADGQWQSFAHSAQVRNKEWFRMIRTKDDSYWMGAARSGGICVFNTQGTPENISDDKHNFFIPKTADGEESSSDIRSLEQDLDGTVWAGTGEGIFVYHYPEDVFKNPVYADRIQLTSVGADTSEQYLLKTEMVTAIKTDGGNRKWLGTQNSGVFLVSPDGKQQIHAFNTENSPLVSNTINDIAIDHKSGRVFFATSEGLISYRAEATRGAEDFEKVYVFPNPVRPGYEGKITVTGLPENSNVKITDISGSLVYKTQSIGGQAFWNGKNLKGQRIHTGVYLVFCTNKDGSQSHVTKLLFIN